MIHDYVGNYATYQHLLLRSERGSTGVGWSKFIGIRGLAEGQRGHYFFWLVKQRGHDFFPPVKQRGQDLFWSVKQWGHDFFIHSKQHGQDICLYSQKNICFFVHL